MIKRLAHVCLGAKDLAASRAFYVSSLAWKWLSSSFAGGQPIGFYLRAGEGAFIEVFADEAAADAERPRIKHFCLEVEDLDGLIASFSERGVDITQKQLGGDNAWQAWMTDPSGIRIELMQYRPDSAQFTGLPDHLDG